MGGKSSQEYPVNAEVLQDPSIGPKLFLLYLNNLPDNVICNIAIYGDDATLYCKCNQASDLWKQLELASELNLIYETLWTGAGSGLLISLVEKLNWFCLTGLIILVLSI